MDPAYIQQILKANKQKNFVQRIMSPENWPVTQNKDGTESSHKMAWGSFPDADGFMVYPTIVWDGKQLKELDDRSAYENALETGEYITFPDSDSADAFSREYKKVWSK